jgi:hypothetical protein
MMDSLSVTLEMCNIFGMAVAFEGEKVLVR